MEKNVNPPCHCKSVFLNEDLDARRAAYTEKWAYIVQRMASGNTPAYKPTQAAS